MIRRQFLKLATLTGATGLASLGTLDAFERKSKTEMRNPASALPTSTVTWRVAGFTCITCAVGLETMLRRQNGVASATASYPRASVTIQFHPDIVSEPSLRSFISELGFSASTDIISTAEDQKG